MHARTYVLVKAGMTPSFISEFQVSVHGQEENSLMLPDRSYPGESIWNFRSRVCNKTASHREDIPNQIPPRTLMISATYRMNFRLCFLAGTLKSSVIEGGM